MTDMSLFVLSIIVSWILQNSIHELSHLIVAYILEGRKPIEFRPFPTLKNGIFYFAYCRYSEPVRYSKYPWLIYIAPFWAGLIWSVIPMVLVFIASFYCNKAVWMLLPYVVAPLIDAVFFWWTYIFGRDFTDGKKYKYTRYLRSRV